MATLKDVQLKIAAVKKTRQITKAMNMVAASRLRGAQTRMEAFRPYVEKFSQVLGSLAERSAEGASPLLVEREKVENIHVVLCTSDRGLCGGFNANLITKVETFLKEEAAADNMPVSLTAFGKKGRDFFKKTEYSIAAAHLDVVGGTFGFNVAMDAGRTLIDAYMDGTYDKVFIVFSEFVTMAKQVPVLRQLLPIPPIETAEEAETTDNYLPEHICEPSPEALLNEMLPRNVFIQIYSALLETSTSEHAARMMAMNNATKACNDMIDSLTLAYNKARQAGITADLMDIVGGSEALRG